MAGKKVRSAKGLLVDFDLLKIKEQIASNPAPMDVKARQDHIDKRLRRRIRTAAKTPVASPVTVKPTLPSAENANQVEPLIDAPETTDKSKTKQKARSKKTDNT